MSAFRHIKPVPGDGSDYWVHESLSIAFPQKPPEWIAPFLVRIYEKGYDDGERNTQRAAAEFARAMGWHVEPRQ